MSHPPSVSCIPNTAKMSKAKKVIEEAKEINNPEIDLVDKGISSLDEIPGLCKYSLTYLFFLLCRKTSFVRTVSQQLKTNVCFFYNNSSLTNNSSYLVCGSNNFY